MNNKGQILPIFVILFPVILLIVLYVSDIGQGYILKRKLTNITKDAIVYYIDNITEDDVYEKTSGFIEKNTDSTYSIVVSNNIVTIKLEKEYKSIIVKNSKVIVTYKGNITTKKVIKG